MGQLVGNSAFVFAYAKSRFPHGMAHSYQFSKLKVTHQPLYNTVCYNTILDITQFNNGSQKCIDYIEK